MLRHINVSCKSVALLAIAQWQIEITLSTFLQEILQKIFD